MFIFSRRGAEADELSAEVFDTMVSKPGWEQNRTCRQHARTDASRLVKATSAARASVSVPGDSFVVTLKRAIKDSCELLKHAERLFKSQKNPETFL